MPEQPVHQNTGESHPNDLGHLAKEAPKVREVGDAQSPISAQTWLVRAGLVLVVLAVAFIARSILIPVAGAVLLSVTLSPTVRWLSRRGVPRYLSAFGFAGLVSYFCVLVLVTLGSMVGSWINDAPQHMDRLGDRLEAVRAPLGDLSDATQELMPEGEQGGQEDDGPASNDAENGLKNEVVKPPIAPSSPTGSVTDSAFWIDVLGVLLGQSLEILVGFFICVTLTFFLLLSGDVFLAKLLSLSPSLTGKKEVMSIVREIETEISRFLGMWTLINMGVGLVTWIGFECLGVPNAWVWGVTSMLFNYVPYAGPWVLGGAALLMGLMTFDSTGRVLMPAALILVVNMFEGFIISPMMHGRRLKLNTVAVFLSVILGGWLWGIAGALMAVPILVMVYVVCSHLPGLRPAALFLDDSAPGLHRGRESEKGDASSSATPGLADKTA